MSKDNQHFVSQGYLRGFTIPNERSLIWEYDKELGCISKNPKSVRDICSKFQYYAQPNENGEIDKERMENAFQIVEDKAIRIIRGIQASHGNLATLSGKDHGTLSYFLGLLMSRGPSFRDGVEDMHKVTVEKMVGLIVEQDRQNGSLPAAVEKLYNEGKKVKVSILSHVSLRPMLDFAEWASRSLLNKLWSFVIPKGEFVTSDNPVSFRTPDKFKGEGASFIGPIHPRSEITIPLRKNLALICRPSEEYNVEQIKVLQFVSVQLDDNDTENINRRIAIAARRFIYASQKSETFRQIVQGYKGTEQRISVG